MRALEAGRDMVRAANDGISALISADGKVMSTLPRFKEAVLTGAVQPRTGLTPYARSGNWPVLLACIMGLLWSVLSTKFNARTSSNNGSDSESTDNG